MDPDQYVLVPQLRLRHFAKPHAIVLAITIEDERLHEFCFFDFSLKALLGEIIESV
jgi:hypothetical protein